MYKNSGSKLGLIVSMEIAIYYEFGIIKYRKSVNS